MSDQRWKRGALRELTLVRYREFIREPEAIFWGFAFPILLAVCLGVAFRNQPPEILRVAAVSPAIKDALAQDKQLDVLALSADDARAALRAGTVTLVAEPGAAGQVIFHYDDASPEARTARILADRAVQRAAGRVDPV